ncbi:HD-GYP domain-containing protein [Caldicellulosiruptor bescii]|uniref:Metal dependent phosphohydrolase n=2 Tax=Caldicellulosiruptor bescii TaxID=31899 RepID=B9MNI4_CALBD|nr:HD domain-containing protein [Caldicellulosiruptor bescii]ACM61515.1 metal dependent phosphohydrolase [Caldicellulosiruptor bescii DSM 6725]SMR91685.1 HDIG domain-containing protein [Caldicellulosiruptor bescii]
MQKALNLLLQNMSEKNATLLTHSLNVAKLCTIIAKNLGMDEEFYYTAGLLHDVGKLLVPNALWDKSIAISREELEIFKNHSKWGAELLKMLGLNEFSVIALLHHQDTSDLPLPVQIVAAADKYEAMTSLWRQYKKPVSHKEAIDELWNMGIFQPTVIEALAIAQMELITKKEN